MADSAYQIQFRQEFIAGFEQRQSIVRDTVTTEAVTKGYQATFLVADSGSAEAVTRGKNGLIPGRADNLSQPVATLEEWHDKPQRTNYNLFASQGDGRRIMQMTAMSTLNRKIDDQIITELNTGTNNTGSAAAASMTMVAKAKTKLGNNEVPFDGGISALITPAFEAYLTSAVPQFGSADYVSKKPVDSGEMSWADETKMYLWQGVKWIVHPRLPGAGTSAEKCFMFHRNAIGHAFNTGELSTYAGYNEEHDYSFVRCTGYMGAKLLQNSGVIVMNHDGSAFA